jgi:predicted small secreted protein
MKRVIVFIVAALALAGCNTISGMGKDIEAAGSAVDKAATDTKKKM